MTDTATQEAPAEAAPKQRKAPAKCEVCGEKRPAGGDPKIMGEMSKVCNGCAADMLKQGKCPRCRKGMSTQHHVDNCEGALDKSDTEAAA